MGRRLAMRPSLSNRLVSHLIQGRSGALPPRSIAGEGSSATREVDLTSSRASATPAERATAAEDPKRIPAPLRTGLERSFGVDLSDVRVHRSSTLATSVGARAFARGQEIHIAPGHWNPEVESGRALIAHELWHLVQQSQGRVASSKSRQGIVINDDPDLESEAWTMGRRAAQGDSSAVSGRYPSLSPRAGIAQLDALSEVQAVESNTVTDAQGSVSQLKGMLAKRVAKRKREIEEAMPSKPGKRQSELQRDLDKTVQQIVESEDSKGIYKGLRKDIIEADKLLRAAEKKLATRDKRWHEFDSTFASREVVDELAKIGLRAADLKAQLARESGDLMQDDQEGDIAGIAQLSTDEEKQAGGAPGDRKDPQKAIKLAAKAMVEKARLLKRGLTTVPAGVEWKKFLFAAYNAGPNAIITAQKEAIADKKVGATWDELIDGGETSFLRRALNKHFKKKPTPEEKFVEVVQYVHDITAKLLP